MLFHRPRSAAVDTLDAQCILVLIMGAIRAERFSDDALLNFFKDGFILKWLERLKAIEGSGDNENGWNDGGVSSGIIAN